MSDSQWPFALAALLFAAGMWLLLPNGRRTSRRLGAGLTTAGLALLTLLVHFGLIVHNKSPYMEWSVALPQGEGWFADGVFLAMAIVTVGSAVAAVTLRSPVYCALWFALTLLGTAGLFLYQGAQFLGVATIVVYAGAILVTFLFVLMLAQPQGDEYYDRLSWEALLSSVAGAVMIGMLAMTTSSALADPGRVLEDQTTLQQVATARNTDILSPQHVATLGSHLFSTHLIAVEVAGTLLLVALVGAIAIVGQHKRPETGGPPHAGNGHTPGVRLAGGPTHG
jgi:NADH-quinone oxidoreductase subunit J